MSVCSDCGLTYDGWSCDYCRLRQQERDHAERLHQEQLDAQREAQALLRERMEQERQLAAQRQEMERQAHAERMEAERLRAEEEEHRHWVAEQAADRRAEEIQQSQQHTRDLAYAQATRPDDFAAEGAIEQAATRLKIRDVAGARTLLRDIIARTPAYPWTHLALARLEHHQGDREACLRSLGQAIVCAAAVGVEPVWSVGGTWRRELVPEVVVGRAAEAMDRLALWHRDRRRFVQTFASAFKLACNEFAPLPESVLQPLLRGSDRIPALDRGTADRLVLAALAESHRAAAEAVIDWRLRLGLPEREEDCKGVQALIPLARRHGDRENERRLRELVATPAILALERVQGILAKLNSNHEPIVAWVDAASLDVESTSVVLRSADLAVENVWQRSVGLRSRIDELQRILSAYHEAVRSAEGKVLTTSQTIASLDGEVAAIIRAKSQTTEKFLVKLGLIVAPCAFIGLYSLGNGAATCGYSFVAIATISFISIYFSTVGAHDGPDQTITLRRESELAEEKLNALRLERDRVVNPTVPASVEALMAS